MDKDLKGIMEEMVEFRKGLVEGGFSSDEAFELSSKLMDGIVASSSAKSMSDNLLKQMNSFGMNGVMNFGEDLM